MVSNEDLHPGVHTEDTYPVIGHWDHPFQGIAYPILGELLIRLSYFLWDALSGLPEGQG